jgi:hypothetical protein
MTLSDKQLVERCCGQRCKRPTACERHQHTGPYRGFDSRAAYYEHYSNIENYRDELPAMAQYSREAKAEQRGVNNMATQVRTRDGGGGGGNRAGGNVVDMSNLKEFAARLNAGIQKSQSSTVIAGGGKPLLRLRKELGWQFGPSNEQVQEGSQWAVNIFTLSHGWQCWVRQKANDKGVLKGEVFVPITSDKPPRPAPIDGTEFEEARSFELKCTLGDDEGLEVQYKVRSIGGLRACSDLVDAISEQLVHDPAHATPVIELEMDSYEHKGLGTLVYIPIFKIVEWTDYHINNMPADASGDEDVEQLDATGDPPFDPEPDDNGEDDDNGEAFDEVEPPHQPAQRPRTQPTRPAAPQPTQRQRPAAAAAQPAQRQRPAAATAAATAKPSLKTTSAGKPTTKAAEAPRQGQRRRPGR